MATPSQAPKKYDWAAARYRERNRAKLRERMRLWRAKHKDKIRVYARRYRAKQFEKADTPEKLAALRALESRRTHDTVQRIKDAVYRAYGGYKCKCCGVTERSFLSIDHVENNGYHMKKNGLHPKNPGPFYRWLRKNGYPKGFQILCMNCQFGKKLNNGICPHQMGKV